MRRKTEIYSLKTFLTICLPCFYDRVPDPRDSFPKFSSHQTTDFGMGASGGTHRNGRKEEARVILPVCQHFYHRVGDISSSLHLLCG